MTSQYTPSPGNARNPEARQLRAAAVLEAALQVAEVSGFQWITRESVAARAGVSVATVSNAFGDMIALKRAVLREAVRRPVLAIIAQDLTHPIVREAPEHIRKQAHALLLG